MLRCEECGRRAETNVEAHGWRVYLTANYDDEEAESAPDDFAVYCPECAEREFGEDVAE
jgi:hypothetical protein